MATPPKRPRKRRSPKAEFFQRAAQEYMRINKVTEFDPDDVAKWMISTRQYEEQSYSVVRRCRQELTKALKAQHVTDPQGREVRAMLSVRHRDEQGELWSTWSPLYQAKPDHARLSLQQWRRSMRGEVLLHDRTARSYNDNNVHGAQLQLFDYDFNRDRDEDAMPKDYPDERPE
jgi:hypothetical protein